MGSFLWVRTNSQKSIDYTEEVRRLQKGNEEERKKTENCTMQDQGKQKVHNEHIRALSFHAGLTSHKSQWFRDIPLFYSLRLFENLATITTITTHTILNNRITNQPTNKLIALTTLNYSNSPLFYIFRVHSLNIMEKRTTNYSFATTLYAHSHWNFLF